MATYQIASAGDGFRIIVVPRHDRNKAIGGFFTAADANAWLATYLSTIRATRPPKSRRRPQSAPAAGNN
jgi:hypothetical protein